MCGQNRYLLVSYGLCLLSVRGEAAGGVTSNDYKSLDEQRGAASGSTREFNEENGKI